MGDANASIPTPQPVHYREMFGAKPSAAVKTSVTFVSGVSIENDLADSLSLRRSLVACSNTRNITKKDMLLNDATPDISVDPETYEVLADGQLLTCEPATSLPLAQLYCLF